MRCLYINTYIQAHLSKAIIFTHKISSIPKLFVEFSCAHITRIHTHMFIKYQHQNYRFFVCSMAYGKKFYFVYFIVFILLINYVLRFSTKTHTHAQSHTNTQAYSSHVKCSRTHIDPSSGKK